MGQARHSWQTFILKPPGHTLWTLAAASQVTQHLVFLDPQLLVILLQENSLSLFVDLVVEEKSLKTQYIWSQKQVRLHFDLFIHLFKSHDHKQILCSVGLRDTYNFNVSFIRRVKLQSSYDARPAQ